MTYGAADVHVPAQVAGMVLRASVTRTPAQGWPAVGHGSSRTLPA